MHIQIALKKNFYVLLLIFITINIFISNTFEAKAAKISESFDAKKMLKENEEEIANSEKRVQELEQAIKEEQEKTKALNAEKSDIERKAKEESEALEQQKKETEKELSEFNNKADSKIKNLANEINSLEDKLSKKEQENSEVGSELDSAERDLENYAQQNDKNSEERTRYEQELEKQNELIKSQKELLQEKVDDLRILTDSYKSLQGTSSQVESSYLSKIDDIKSEVLALRKKLDESLFTVGDLKANKDILDAKYEKDTKALTEIIRKNQETELANLSEIDSLQNRILHLKNSLKEVLELKSTYDADAESKIKLLSEKIQLNKESFENTLNAYQDAERKQLDKIDELRSLIVKQRTFNRQLHEENKQLKYEKAHEDMADNKAELGSMQKIDDLSSMLLRSRNRNEELVKDKRFEDMADNKAELRNMQKIDDLSSMLLRSRNMNDKLIQRNKELESMLLQANNNSGTLYKEATNNENKYVDTIHALKDLVISKDAQINNMTKYTPWIKERTLLSFDDISKNFGIPPTDFKISDLESKKKN